MPSARVTVNVGESISVPAVADGPVSSIWEAWVARGGQVPPAPALGLERSEEQLAGSCTDRFGVNPERRRRRAALQAGFFWEMVDEGFVGGYIMIDLTGTGLIKARSQLSLQPGQGVLWKMISLLFRNAYFSSVGKFFNSVLLHPGTETGLGHGSVFPHRASPLPRAG